MYVLFCCTNTNSIFNQINSIYKQTKQIATICIDSEETVTGWIVILVYCNCEE